MNTNPTNTQSKASFKLAPSLRGHLSRVKVIPIDYVVSALVVIALFLFHMPLAFSASTTAENGDTKPTIEQITPVAQAELDDHLELVSIELVKQTNVSITYVPTWQSDIKLRVKTTKPLYKQGHQNDIAVFLDEVTKEGKTFTIERKVFSTPTASNEWIHQPGIVASPISLTKGTPYDHFEGLAVRPNNPEDLQRYEQAREADEKAFFAAHDARTQAIIATKQILLKNPSAAVDLLTSGTWNESCNNGQTGIMTFTKEGQVHMETAGTQQTAEYALDGLMLAITPNGKRTADMWRIHVLNKNQLTLSLGKYICESTNTLS